MQLLLRWAVNAGALYATVFILNQIGLATLGKGPWYSWFIAVIIMGLVNALVRPILRLFTAPLNCLTFGLVGVVINALMFWLVPVIAQSAGMPIFTVKPLGAVLGSMLVGLIGALAGKLIIRKEEEEE